jgi:hypothetical protein
LDVAVTYVHHDCFCLDAAGWTLLFDYPDAAHRPPGARGAVRRALAGRRAAACFSHSHADHCGADVFEAARDAAGLHLVLSFDVPEMVPGLDRPGAVVLEPGDDPRGGDPGPWAGVGPGLRARALESNDLGVAFCLDVGGLRVYHGGDLAAWLRPGQDAAGAAAVRAFFERSLAAVAAFAPHVAFACCDPRLPGRGGFARFAEVVRPPVLVPMHDFGRPRDVGAYALGAVPPGVEVLAFEVTGQRRELRAGP